MGIGEIIGGLISSVVTSGANMQLQDKQNAENRRMYYEQRDYNTPSNQMERLKQANLNPALMYGTGSGANMAGPPPRMEATSVDNPSNDIAAYTGVENMDAQREGIVQSNVNLKIEAGKKNAEIESIRQGVLNAKNQNDKITADTRNTNASAKATELDNAIRKQQIIQLPRGQAGTIFNYLNNSPSRVANPDNMVPKKVTDGDSLQKLKYHRRFK